MCTWKNFDHFSFNYLRSMIISIHCLWSDHSLSGKIYLCFDNIFFSTHVFTIFFLVNKISNLIIIQKEDMLLFGLLNLVLYWNMKSFNDSYTPE